MINDDKCIHIHILYFYLINYQIRILALTLAYLLKVNSLLSDSIYIYIYIIIIIITITIFLINLNKKQYGTWTKETYETRKCAKTLDA